MLHFANRCICDLYVLFAILGTFFQLGESGAPNFVSRRVLEPHAGGVMSVGFRYILL